jgi:poly(3-hydroxybutyrate) depolymerase
MVPAVASAQTATRIEHDIAYAAPRNKRQLLDVYAPPGGSALPVVVWVHGATGDAATKTLFEFTAEVLREPVTP